jgi:hypothetical protein
VSALIVVEDLEVLGEWRQLCLEVDVVRPRAAMNGH